jgi:gluconokinase
MIDYVIGIDLGTGSTKALAVNRKGHVLRTAQVHYSIVTPHPGYCEQDPEAIWKAFVIVMNTIMKEVEFPPSAIIFSSAMHSVIPVNTVGQPLHPMVIWSDNRSAAIAQRLYHSSAGKTLYEETGTPIHAMSPLTKIIWFRENMPELFQQVDKFISIKEYLWFRLFGEYQVDHSVASATGLMDILKLTWNDQALTLAQLTDRHLSTLVSTSYTRNDIDAARCHELGLPAPTTFCIGSSDGCMANLGSFAIDDGIGALTIGTSGAVRIASREPIYEFGSMTFNYRLDETYFICGGPTNNGGSALKWYVESFLNKPLLTPEDYHSVLATLNHTAPGAEGLIFLPYLFGERAPIWNSEACGVFFGIRSYHRQEHFTRAVVEGISMALFDILDRLMANGAHISQVHVSGGFVKSTLWLQVLADIFDKKICLINSDDASALGAAFIGLKKLGLISSYQSLKPEVVKEIYPRSETRRVYEKMFRQYRELYPALKVTMAGNDLLSD